jgi:hypothetical protein
MLATVAILLIGAVISFLEIPPLIKKKWWREVIVFFLLLSAGLTLTILLFLNVPIPSYPVLLDKIYRPINIFMERILS